VFLAASFVGVEENAGTYENLKALVGDAVDEIMFYEANSRCGGHFHHKYPLLALDECNFPFNEATITREGYLRAAANDYENDLAIADLNKVTLKDAWHSETSQDLRDALWKLHSRLSRQARAAQPGNWGRK